MAQIMETERHEPRCIDGVLKDVPHISGDEEKHSAHEVR